MNKETPARETPNAGNRAEQQRGGHPYLTINTSEPGLIRLVCTINSDVDQGKVLDMFEEAAPDLFSEFGEKIPASAVITASKTRDPITGTVFRITLRRPAQKS